MKMKIKIENRNRNRCHPVTLSPSVVKWWHYSHFKVSDKRRDARQVPVDLRLLMRALQHPFVVWFSGLQLRVLCSTYALQGQHAIQKNFHPVVHPLAYEDAGAFRVSSQEGFLVERQIASHCNRDVPGRSR